MEADLIFLDWKLKGKSVYGKVPELSAGSFHSGSTFKIQIRLNPELEKELRQAIANGYTPEFMLGVD